MARRVYITSSMFRISKAGFDAATATEGQLLFAENRASMTPAMLGSFSIPADSSIDIVLPEAGKIPFTLLTSSYIETIVATFNSAKTIMTLRNRNSTTVTGRYFILKNRLYT